MYGKNVEKLRKIIDPDYVMGLTGFGNWIAQV
jgi:hypothetical protein